MLVHCFGLNVMHAQVPTPLEVRFHGQKTGFEARQVAIFSCRGYSEDRVPQTTVICADFAIRLANNFGIPAYLILRYSCGSKMFKME